jgi:hypothetical protein
VKSKFKTGQPARAVAWSLSSPRSASVAVVGVVVAEEEREDGTQRPILQIDPSNRVHLPYRVVSRSRPSFVPRSCDDFPLQIQFILTSTSIRPGHRCNMSMVSIGV